VEARGCFSEELLQGLVEALDLAAGLGVIGARVLVVDAEVKQLGLERGVAVAIGGREDAAVVGQKRRRQTPGGARLVE
jgi:hypothetical protein